MKKISNKGFVLAETIVVAVFMVTIFTILYANYYPLMGQYERREFYDDVDSKYVAFWLKYIIQDADYDFGPVKTEITNNGFSYFTCEHISDGTSTAGGTVANSGSYKRSVCDRLVYEAGLSSNPYCKNGATYCNSGADEDAMMQTKKLGFVAIVTNYKLQDFKTKMHSTSTLYNGLSDGLIDYINYLPDYTHDSPNGANYRIIIELFDNNERERSPKFKYSTIEVKR